MARLWSRTAVSRFIPSFFAALLLLASALLQAAPPENPTSLPLLKVDGFEEPLVPMYGTTPKEDRALAEAISTYRSQLSFDDLAVFETFLNDYPHSGWNVGILANLGLAYYRQGYFSRAIDAWERAWQAEKTRPADNPTGKMLADRAIGELARMHARLGHAPELETLFQDIGERAVSGPATERVAGAKEGLWMMQNNPGVAYLCGPMALKNLLLIRDATPGETAFIDKVRSGPEGMTLAEVSQLARQASLPYRLVYRETGQRIPVPSIVHWKVNHFAAIVAEMDGYLHIKDPTFGSDLWITTAAFEAESSGYFLVPEKEETALSWRTVSLGEAATVRGMGYTGNNDDTTIRPDDTKAKPPACKTCPSQPPCKGMCDYNIHEMTVSLNLTDTPVGYAPPIGPSAYVTLTYNQREANQPAVFGWFNISPKWTLNWLSYIQDNPGVPTANVMRYVAGGGSVDYSGYNSATGAFTSDRRDASVLVRTSTSPITYERRLANGAKEIYAHSNGSTANPRRVFLTQVIDPAGNAVTLSYDDQLRLTALTDATGRSTVFSYELSAKPLLITTITDPFGRSAKLEYDGNGRLIRITDVLGLTSEFTYDAASLVNALTTPYGTTKFAYGGTGNYRWLNATDPLGQTERVEYRQSAPGIPFSEPSQTIPQGIIAPFNAYLDGRNSFYWDKHAYQVAPGDYTKARIRHWTHLGTNTNFTGNTIESIKNPFENRIWFNYPGQPNGGLGTAVTGTLDKPSRIGRVLDDGTTQLTQLEYNSLGQVTKTIDPVGRETLFEYDANQIDLLRVRQKTSASGYSTVVEFTYNSQHLPLTYKNAAGQTTTYAYNSAGQPLQATDALGQVTRFEYDGLGYLVRVVNPDNQTAVSFTYDSFGRRATRTDSEGHTLSYEYDTLDQLTQITYPDGTTTQFAYDRLDLVSVTDRLGRVTSYSYDAVRRMTAISDPMGQTTGYGYYANGVLRSLTDPEGNTTRWDIDIQSRPTAKVYADSSAETYAYEAKTSRLRSMTDALGQTRQYGYTKDDRLAALNYANAISPTPGVSFAYDPYFPRRTTMTDGAGTTQFQYGAVGSLGALKLTGENGPYANDEISYQYDQLGRMTSRKVDAITESFAYDKLDRVTQHTNPLGSFNFSYLGQTGQLVSQQSGAVGTQWGYEDNTHDRRLKSITNSGLARGFHYATTPENQISTLTETAGGAAQKSWHYGYDGADRLLSAQPSSGGSFSYGYDPADNLTSLNGAMAHYNNVNQLTSFNSESFSYDANGNLKDDGVRTYQWDAENRLLSIGYKNDASKATTFRYDGMGRRLAIIETNGGATTETRHLWCGATLCQARTAGDVVIRRYYSEGMAIPQGGTLLYYGTDHLGSVRDVMAAQNGAKVASYDYDPYGNQIATSGRISVDFRYAGMFYHQQSGLYLTNFRAYDPKTGRWLSRDPIEEEGGRNLYGYVGGNPLSFVDPYGLDIEYANHEVAMGLYHSKIIITPNNQAAYANDPRFQNIDASGRRFATIGAGPNAYGMLEAGVNRPRDVSMPNATRKKLDLLCYANEDDAIKNLFLLAENYNNHKRWYTLIPTKIFGISTGYNSNSFISGLGNAAGFNMPAANATGQSTPGYQNVLPAWRFGP